MISKVLQLFQRGSKGFSLIETLVAVLILVVAISGPLTIASRGLNSALIEKNRITAYYLAQDAIEYIRFVRDTNALKGYNGPVYNGSNGTGLSWLAGLDGYPPVDTSYIYPDGNKAAGDTYYDCLSATGCYLDTTGNKILTQASIDRNVVWCGNTGCFTGNKHLNYNSSSNRFTYSSVGGFPTIEQMTFIRQISIKPPAGSASITNEAVVTVKVQWSDSAGSHAGSVTQQENLYLWQ